MQVVYNIYMDNKYTTFRIKRSSLERLRRLAHIGFRSPPEQLDAMIDAFETLHIKSVETLSHPDNANPVPVIMVEK